MRVTIVREDNTVIVDGLHQTVDCSALGLEFHALQWYGDYGEIEIVDPTKPHHYCVENRRVSDLTSVQLILDAFDRQKAAREAAIAEVQKVKEPTTGVAIIE